MAENTGNANGNTPRKDSGTPSQHDSQEQQYENATGWDEEGHPHFGQMRSKYGPNYNPYRFGGPEPTNNNRQRMRGHNRRENRQTQSNGNAAWNQSNPGWGGNGYPNGQQGPQGQYGPNNPYGYNPNPNGYGNGYNNPNGYNGNPSNGYGPNGNYRNPQGGWNPPQNNPQQGPNYPYGTNPYMNPYNMPFGMQQFNPDDPNQNPVYGHWDWTAIFAFILSLTAYFCFIALPLGFYAYRRDTVLHMKGKGFAVAAIIISIIEIIGLIFLLLNPSLMQQVLSYAGSGASSTGLIQTLFFL